MRDGVLLAKCTRDLELRMFSSYREQKVADVHIVRAIIPQCVEVLESSSGRALVDYPTFSHDNQLMEYREDL